jgi:cell division septal protein FtsQ
MGNRVVQKGARSKPIERRRWVASLVVGVLIALLIGAGAFVLLVMWGVSSVSVLRTTSF